MNYLQLDNIKELNNIYKIVGDSMLCNLAKQKIILDKQLNFKSVEIMNSNGITQMHMVFDSVDYNSNFNDDYL